MKQTGITASGADAYGGETTNALLPCLYWWYLTWLHCESEYFQVDTSEVKRYWSSCRCARQLQWNEMVTSLGCTEYRSQHLRFLDCRKTGSMAAGKEDFIQSTKGPAFRQVNG